MVEGICFLSLSFVDKSVRQCDFGGGGWGFMGFGVCLGLVCSGLIFIGFVVMFFCLFVLMES